MEDGERNEKLGEGKKNIPSFKLCEIRELSK